MRSSITRITLFFFAVFFLTLGIGADFVFMHSWFNDPSTINQTADMLTRVYAPLAHQMGVDEEILIPLLGVGGFLLAPSIGLVCLVQAIRRPYPRTRRELAQAQFEVEVFERARQNRIDRDIARVLNPPRI